MPSVRELSALYENVMLGPRRGPGVCGTCFNFTDGYARCYACDHGGLMLDAVAPISYSVAREQLHHALASYKRLDGDVARQLGASLAAILWRFLAEHERCVAHAAGTGGHEFELVTTVPSGDRLRDDRHPLKWIVGELVAPTRDRYERVLRRTDVTVQPRAFSGEKFVTTADVEGRSVLLIDDTWTTGASAQSAASALKAAGATTVAAVVIGRHLNREWHENDRRIRGIARPFDWGTCALCAEPAAPRPQADRNF
jgi:predicted phosphoribosyltransferase